MRLLLAAAAVLALTACGNDPQAPDGPRGTFRTAEVKVGDRTVPCITWKDGYGGGVSCDWSAR